MLAEALEGRLQSERDGDRNGRRVSWVVMLFMRRGVSVEEAPYPGVEVPLREIIHVSFKLKGSGFVVLHITHSHLK